MKTVIIVMAILALAAVRALAGNSRTFSGWSKDGSYWVVTTEGEDDDSVVFCPSHKDVAPTWPAGLPKERDERGCATMTPDAYKAAKLPELATLVNAVEPLTHGPTMKGPGGLKATVKRVKNGMKELWISRGKAKLKADVQGLEAPDTLDDLFWRPDGGAVAVAISVITSKDEFSDSTVDVVDLSSLGPAAAPPPTKVKAKKGKK